MSQPHEIEARLAAVEARVEEVAADAAAARHLAAAGDRDLADLGVKVDANRTAINALGIQTAARFDRLERTVHDGFAQADRNFLTIRGLLDATAATQQRTTDLLAELIEQRGER